jgi:preprotein translocase subunit Sss1
VADVHPCQKSQNGLKTQKSIGVIIKMGYKPTKQEFSDIIRVGKAFSEKIWRR